MPPVKRPDDANPPLCTSERLPRKRAFVGRAAKVRREMVPPTEFEWSPDAPVGVGEHALRRIHRRGDPRRDMRHVGGMLAAPRAGPVTCRRHRSQRTTANLGASAAVESKHVRVLRRAFRAPALDANRERAHGGHATVGKALVPISLRFNSRFAISVNRQLC